MSYSLRIDVPLPDGTTDDPYDADALAETLHEIAYAIGNLDLPPLGDIWDGKGRLLGHVRINEHANASL